MKKNLILIFFVGVLFICLIISNLYFIKETVELNEQLSRIYELEETIINLKAEHQREIEKIYSEHEAQIREITIEYDEKVIVVKKTLNALEYEIEEFYRNKHIIKEDYLENLKKINEAKEKLEDDLILMPLFPSIKPYLQLTFLIVLEIHAY